MRLLGLFLIGLMLLQSTAYANQDTFKDKVSQVKSDLEEQNLTVQQLKEERVKLVYVESQLELMLKKNKTEQLSQEFNYGWRIIGSAFFAYLGFQAIKMDGVAKKAAGVLVGSLFSYSVLDKLHDLYKTITQTSRSPYLLTKTGIDKMNEIISDTKVNIAAIDLVLAEQ